MILKPISFMTSLMTFYLKGEIAQQNNFVTLKIPNTILGFIPLGSQTEKLPIGQISMVGTNFRLLFKQFIVGIITAIIGLSVMGSSLLTGLIFLLIGAGMVINSFQNILVIDLTSGRAIRLSFLIFEKSKITQAEQEINKLISNRMDDTNNRIHTEKAVKDNREQNKEQTDRIIEAINSQK